MIRMQSIKIDGVIYPVKIIYKRIKNIHFRYKDGAFEVTCHYFTPLKIIRNYLKERGANLIQKTSPISPINENNIYIFGQQYDLNFPLIIDEKEILFSNQDDLKIILKDILLEYIKERTSYYFGLMNISDNYKIVIKDNSHVIGSNSRHTKTLSFSSKLIHFSKEIIDSVIVHECAHCFAYNHSKDFYDIVYQYFPNYNLCRKKLIHSIFA